MDTTREWPMPSGSEVESAVLHPAVGSVGTSITLPERSSGLRGRLDGLKARGQSKVHDIRSAALRTSSAVRYGTTTKVRRMQSSMRTNPMKWAGVATAAGFGLGMIGRIAHWRSRQRGSLPSLVVIETNC